MAERKPLTSIREPNLLAGRLRPASVLGLVLATACFIVLVLATFTSRRGRRKVSALEYAAMYRAIHRGRSDAILPLLSSVDLNHEFMDGETLLMRAANDGDIIALRHLLENDAGVDRSDRWGTTALGSAVAARRIAACRILLKAGANPNGVEWGDPPLVLAADRSLPEVVSLLLNAGAAIDRQDLYGDTALMKAVLRDDIETAKLLKARGADSKLSNKKGQTAQAIVRSPNMRRILSES